ncbi:uncharacterized protein LOC119671913 [Teleopsis dalmanni]|uniref:uncharacterized protein LOC119671913 n=1 Tax=Teleopsis dalmanni TaxID=139649 RepID=UPI0018CF2AA4|nr:uncharacterized protein LOC119671913 [Teleopsis dalmanni]
MRHKQKSQARLETTASCNNLCRPPPQTREPIDFRFLIGGYVPKTSTLDTANYNASTASSTDTGHQYHYIQYQQAAKYNCCHCTCTCIAQNAHQQRPMVQNSFPMQKEQQQLQQSQPPTSHDQQQSNDKMAVAVVVHQRSGVGVDTEHAHSETSLLHHSYQALQVTQAEDKPLNVLANSKHNSSCDCDLECTCSASVPKKQKHSNLVDAVIGADEITVSESDNNSTILKKKKIHDCPYTHKKIDACCENHNPTVIRGKVCNSNYNSSQIDIYNESIITDGETNERPPLPPRPALGPRSMSNTSVNPSNTGLKKYVIWCLICGGFSCLLGLLFLGVYFLLHSYTITVGSFETVPTFVPAALLILTGLCIISLAKRKNRYSYLIKLSGVCGLISALTCALVTVTTTVLHMSRLQALRECEYAQKTRTCTCYSDVIDSRGDVDRVDKGIRLVFDSLSDCGVVHGSLYSCLRAIFGLSVAGVLIAVFSCMLVYQLLSHERKKMYWEQLELRCRSLYTSQHAPPTNIAPSNTRNPVCRCCEQCHAHRQMPLQTTAYPWDENVDPRFWNGPQASNFYSPNPGTDEVHAGQLCRGHAPPNSRTRTTGWSWPRMPWQRNTQDANPRFRQTPSSPDSQYGFSNNAQNNEHVINQEELAVAPRNAQPFNVVSNYGVWGPPPPYSDPNSPARRGYYQYIQPNNCVGHNAPTECNTNVTPAEQHMPCINHRGQFLEHRSMPCTTQISNTRNLNKNNNDNSSNNNFKSKMEYDNAHSDEDIGTACDRFSNTLPTRKMKKRIDTGHKSIGHNSNTAVSTQRINVQQVFPNASGNNNILSGEPSTSEATSVIVRSSEDNASGRGLCQQSSMHQLGVENSAFQGASADCGATAIINNNCDPTESEVYFADVSSCCNISVKNDNFYDETNQRNLHGMLLHHHHHQHSNCSHSSSANEDYLAQRFGKRENSKRSRLPFPQTRNEMYDEDNNPINMRCGNNISNLNKMQKEISRQSMCSTESDAKTEFTDLSPSTPCSNKFIQTNQIPTNNSNVNSNNQDPNEIVRPPVNFVATFPYSSESQSLEAHRRSTKNVQQELMLAPEAHYEVISENNCDFAKTTGMQKLSRPNNFLNNKHNEFIHKSKPKSKSRERLDTSENYKSELEWSESSGDNRRHL